MCLEFIMLMFLQDLVCYKNILVLNSPINVTDLLL